MYKKLLAALALSLTAGFASAAPSVGLGVDVEAAGTNGNHYKTQQEVTATVAEATKLGTFDASLIGLRFSGITHDNANGFEFGYSKGVSLSGFGVTGRVGVGRLNNIDPNGGGFTSNSKYYSASVEAQAPVTQRMNAFTEFRHRDGLGDGNAYAMNNRMTLGLDYAFTKHVTARIGLAHTIQARMHLNGVAAAVAYTF